MPTSMERRRSQRRRTTMRKDVNSYALSIPFASTLVVVVSLFALAVGTAAAAAFSPSAPSSLPVMAWGKGLDAASKERVLVGVGGGGGGCDPRRRRRLLIDESDFTSRRSSRLRRRPQTRHPLTALEAAVVGEGGSGGVDGGDGNGPREVLERTAARTSATTTATATVSLEEDGPKREFYIREARFSELNAVTDIVMDAFYPPNHPLRPIYRIAELNRVQSNFPYSDPSHSFYVAVCQDTDDVVGFCDVDGRPPSMNRRKRDDEPPKPYLSDLAVRTDWRRCGVAKALIRTCEVRAKNMGHDRMYLRVESTNGVALKMYAGLGYDPQRHGFFGVKDTTVLLRSGTLLLTSAVAADDAM